MAFITSAIGQKRKFKLLDSPKEPAPKSSKNAKDNNDGNDNDDNLPVQLPEESASIVTTINAIHATSGTKQL